LGEESIVFMRARFFTSAVITLAIALIIAQRASAQHVFAPTAPGTYDSNSGANWSGGVPTGDGNDVDFTQTPTGTQLVTNLFSANGGDLNYLRLATGGGNLLTVVSTAGFTSQYGLQLNANDTLVLASSTYNLSLGNDSFNNALGTLAISNGATAFVNIGNNGVQNQGTITMDAGSGQTSDLNYGQSTATFNNSGTGTIIKNNSGSGNFTGNFGGNNIDFANNGTIIVNGGTLDIDTRSAFNNDGFQNTSSGQIIVNAGANFAIDRTTSAWNGTAEPDNNGTIILNGGTFAVNENGGQNAARLIQNNNFIVGSGTLAASVAQASGGSTIASNGVLDIFGTFGGNQATFTSVSGQFGTFKAVSGGTLKVDGSVASGVGGAWAVNSGGTLEIAASDNVNLSQAFIPGSAIQGTVKVDSGANMTLSSTVNGGAYQDNQGTFLLLGGTVLMPNDTSHDPSGEFTNSTAGAITGNGTLQTGYGSGNVNHAIINHGNITATNGTLVLNSYDAFNLGGVQNAVDGTIVVANGGTLAVARDQNAWNNAAAVTNLGNVAMNGGDVGAVSVDGGTPTKILANASGGLIKGSGTIDSSWTQVNNGGMIFANSQSPLVISASTLNNISGGVVTANTARIVVNGTFNNASGGTFASVSSVGTFNGAVVNSGAWITDPTTNVFNNNYTVTSSGYISASAGDVYDFHSNFVNQSTQNTSYNTLNTTPGGSGAAGTKFIFDGTNTVSSSGYTQTFYTAGLKLTGGFVGVPPSATATQNVSSFPAVTGFDNNYALDRLELGNLGTNSTMELSASADIGGVSGNTNALFVNDLWLFGSSDLIISNNTVLYFVNSNNWSVADITLLGNGQIHQLTLEQLASVPEPSVVLLWLCGIGTVYAARRRAKRRATLE
jgi:fibronectin-binding autotransporter adhesin